MTEFVDKYISPFTGYGFYKLFAEESTKDLLMDFLNELLKGEHGQIKNLTYLKTKQLGTLTNERKAIFEIYCENELGEKFIVELQKDKHNFFKDQTVYYSTFPILKQAKHADWNFEFKAVYIIAILDFVFESDKKEPEKYRYDVKLQEVETNKVLNDKLTFIYLEMPKFNKTIEQLETRIDKWLYVLRNLNRLDRIPDKLRESIFDKLFETAEIARFTPQQVQYYEDSLKTYRDLKNCLDTARREGYEEGIQEGLEKYRVETEEKRKFEFVKNLLIANKFTLAEIANYTNVTETFVEEVKKTM